VVGCPWELGPRKPRLGTRANLGWLLSCRLSLVTSTPPPIALFSAPLPTETGRPGSPMAGGSASAKGEARREAPARRSEATAAPGTLLTRVRVTTELRAGVGDSGGAVGWDRPTAEGVQAGGVTRPDHAPHPRPTPPLSIPRPRC
jgi:hypothetical protein